MVHVPHGFFHDGILTGVQRPSRYIDGELNLSSRGFVEGGFNVLLVFPDAYEIGMSHQGIRLLYHRVAAMDGVGVEFCCAPWPDLESLLRATGEPVRSLQTAKPVADFDLIGFSVQYELHYTNILMLLDLAGLAIESSERGDGDPLIIAGGPCCSNPLPFIKAVDAVFLGDGEESLIEAVATLRDIKPGGGGRNAGREALAGIEGVFVDGVSDSAPARTYRFVEGDLAHAPIVPSSGIVHDRLAVEIMRGCTRGCRFCHAGVMHRPRRERSVEEIAGAVCTGLDASGWDEVSLLSLSTSDYSRLEELLARLAPELEKRKVSLAMPSLRPETVTRQIVAASSAVRRSGFTLAPEAGTERLRRVINKFMSDGEILEGCRKVLDGGWQTLKLYFMIGLPTETGEDLDGIVELTERVLGLPRSGGRFRLGVSISPFVPKPHTPFQWERQCSIGELREKEEYLSRRIRSRRVRLSLRDPAVSTLEGILARGGREMWNAVLSAYRLGCRFDGWRDRLRFDLWRRALEENGLEMEGLLRGFAVDGPLPWDSFVPKVTRRYLIRERERALDGKVTPDCRNGECHGCGACPGDDPNSSRRAGGEGHAGSPVPGAGVSREQVPAAVRYRCIYEKRGRERYLSHLELLNILQRALRRSGLPLSFSRGYHPHPKFSSGPSLPVGASGFREFVDIELTGTVDVCSDIFEGLLPDGIRVNACAGPFSKQVGKLPREALFVYLLELDMLSMVLRASDGEDEGPPGGRGKWSLLGNLLGAPGLRGGGGLRDSDPAAWLLVSLQGMIEGEGDVKDRKGRKRSVEGCSVRGIDGTEAIELRIPAGNVPAPGPGDFLAAVLPAPLAGLVRITRLEILYKFSDSYIDPLALVARRG